MLSRKKTAKTSSLLSRHKLCFYVNWGLLLTVLLLLVVYIFDRDKQWWFIVVNCVVWLYFVNAEFRAWRKWVEYFRLKCGYLWEMWSKYYSVSLLTILCQRSELLFRQHVLRDVRISSWKYSTPILSGLGLINHHRKFLERRPRIENISVSGSTFWQTLRLMISTGCPDKRRSSRFPSLCAMLAS